MKKSDKIEMNFTMNGSLIMTTNINKHYHLSLRHIALSTSASRKTSVASFVLKPFPLFCSLNVPSSSP